MMDNLTDVAENKLLDHLTGRASWTAPSNTYCGLFIVAPTDSTAGTEVPLLNSYARQQITWGAAASGAISNSANIRFPVSGSATGSWGTVVAVGIFDQSTAGTLIMYGTMSATVAIGTSDTYTITSGGLTLTLS